MAPNPQITAAFSSDTFVNNQLDVQHFPLYDTVTFASAVVLTTSASAIFTNVGNNSGKTQGQTNLQQSGRLMAPEAFSIQGFLFKWNEDVLRADLTALLSTPASMQVLQFQISTKVYNQGPLWFYNPGGGIYGFSDKSNEAVYTNGMPGKSERHVLAIPLVIDNQASFQAQLVGGPYTFSAAAGATGFTYQLVLDGYYARGVL